MIKIERIESPNELDLTKSDSLGFIELEDAKLHFKTEINGFDFLVYKNSRVKRKLQQMFNGKCAYCESDIEIITYEDIEHFRPKGAIKLEAQSNLSYPGYYWLAMDWENLLLSCPKCNRTHKKNQFPLVDENNRNRKHTDKKAEKPLLLNPCEDDPKAHIKFLNDGKIMPITSEGEASIKVYGLYRRKLTETRASLAKDIHFKMKQILDDLKAIKFYLKYSDDPDSMDRVKDATDNIISAYDFINSYVSDLKKPYLGMVVQFTKEFLEEYGPSLEELKEKFKKNSSQ